MANVKYVGKRREIALTKETTRLTPESHASGDWKQHTGFEFKSMIEKAVDETAKGKITDVNQKHVVKQWGEGSVPLLGTIQNVGFISDMIMGQDPSSSGSSDIYTHEWTLDDDNNEHQTYTIHTTDPVTGIQQYAGGALDSVDVEMVADAYITIDANMFAFFPTAGTGSVEYATTDQIFKPKEITLKVASTYAGLAGASAINVTEVKFTINKNIEPIHVVGDVDVEDVPNKLFEAEGELKIVHDAAISETLRGYSLDDTTQAVEIEASDGTYSWTIQFPAVSFEGYDEETGLDAINVLTLPFKAEHSDDTNGYLQIDVVNNIVSY